MNNLINMSEYEKIIFVNGLDDSQNEDLKTLSHNYPFVVFFTNNEEAYNKFHYPVANIWKGVKFNDQIIATRLTRFVGIDENNNTIALGDGHTIKLSFDYETGLLGLYDPNKLLSISLYKVSYKNLNGELIDTIGPTYAINALDNKFILTITFFAEGDINNISNALNVNNLNNFTLKSTESLNQSITENNGVLSINNKYTYEIIKDTYENNINSLNDDSNKYIFASSYASNISNISINLGLILNPTQYTIKYNNTSIYPSITFSQNDSDDIKLNITFDPIGVNSYTGRKLFIKMEMPNNDYFKFVDEYGNTIDTTESSSEIIYGSAVFNIKKYNLINNSVQITALFSVYCIYNDNIIYYNNEDLRKSVKLILTGDNVETLWYAGFNNPTNSLFDEGDLQFFDNNGVGVNVLYDWQYFNNELNAPFYIAIPYNYKDIIMPRWDAYTINDEGQKIYVDYRSGFNILRDSYTINNIRFIIYESTVNGKFKGKIQ